MYAEFLLAAGGADLITWQDRVLSPFIDHRLQLLCSVLVGGVLGVLGCFVILRRMALIGDAISHAVLPGVVIAFLLVSTGITGLFVGALLAGVLTAVGINLVTRFSRVKEDTATGIVFTAMFALGVVLISWLPAGTHFDMKCFLFGDPLAVQREDLLSVAIIAPVVIGAVLVLFHPLKLMSFDPIIARTMGFNTTALHYTLMVLLAATVVAALRSVGVIMAIAMLITPAAFAYQLTNRLATMLAVAGVVGALAALAGMFLAFLVDTPPGPTMVLVATVLFLGAMTFAPERGVLVNWLRRRRIRAHIVEEDVLKALVHEKLARLTPAIGTGARELRAALARLTRAGLVRQERGQPRLTEQGRARALEMVRAHRLWETYLADQSIAHAALHEEAERLEHAHNLAEQLADTLGHPAEDPHGEPIPHAPAPRRAQSPE